MNEQEFFEKLEELEQGEQRYRKELLNYLYDRYSSKVWEIIFNILKDRPGSDDCAQETWIRIYKKMHTIKAREPKGVFRFICKVAINTALSELRNKKRRKEISGSDNEFEDRDEDEEKEYVNYLQENMGNIMEQAGMTCKEKEIFSLWLDKIGCKEMVSNTCSYSNVRVLLCRAKSKVIKFLKDEKNKKDKQDEEIP